jgi:uncharacterized protein YfeS
MDIEVYWHEYGSYGGRSGYCLIGDFLALDAPSFGSGIELIELHPNLRPSHTPKKPDKGLRTYLEFLDTLPAYHFLRKKCKLKVEYVSQASKGLDGRNGVYTNEWFTQNYREVKLGLAGLSSRVRAKDDFDITAFLNWVDAKEAQIPATIESFTPLYESIMDRRRKKFGAMDEWDILGIEWEDYHANARALLNTPYFWDCTNEFSPHGNDTGADILALFGRWRKRNRVESSESFLGKILSDWEVSPSPADDDDFSINTHDDAVIGLAFAHLKIDGACPSWCQAAAIEAIGRQRDRLNSRHREWDSYEDKLRRLELLESKLNDCPVL